MKRRVLSLTITLALCLNLCPVWVLAAEESGDSFPTSSKFTLESNKTYTSPCEVKGTMEVDTNGYTLTGSKSDALHVTPTGKLSLTGKVVSKRGVGVVVQSGGLLSITGSDTHIEGFTNALDIASGATVELSAGKYFGANTVIQTADGDYAALLAKGCAYFNASGNPILPADMAQVEGVTISVGPCAGHSEKSYAHDPGAPTHTWTCPYCGTKESEKCTFTFDDSGKGICDLCKNEINVGVDRDSLKELAYDDTVNPAKGTVTVKVKDAAVALTQDADYTVAYSTRANVGNTAFTVTVTVTGKAYNGTFTQDYTFTKDELEKSILQWEFDSKSVNYTGSPVTKDELPAVTINITTSSGVDLHDKLQYSYREQGSIAYIEGLPTNAGIYDVVVSLPGGTDYAAASSDPLELTIKKLGPIVTHPTAAKPIFNYTAQNLVTAGILHPAAVKDGAVILFATSQNGPYSTTIPTGTNAKSYEVWYKVEETSNCNSFSPQQVGGVLIQRKNITPNITLSKTSFTYDGSKQEPTITVKDGTTEIGIDQYTVTWKGDKNQADADILRVVGKYTATIKSKDSGNYTFTATAQVEIVEAAQGGLSITGFPTHVYYGDTITTLGTSGGTGEGTVKWSITPDTGSTGCTINPTTGRLTVEGIGTFTVKAERTVPNYGTVSDTWTFDVEPKPVMAEVTVTAKNYDGTTTANVTAAVKASDLVNGETVTISGLTGTYDNANAGTNKTVTLDDSNATKADGSGKYTVSYPATVKGDINPRNVNVSVTLSGNDLHHEADDTYWYEYDGTDKTPAVTVTADDDHATLAASDYSVSYANNKNVGDDASVTVTAEPDGNYTFTAKTVKFAIRNTSAVLISTPQAKDLTYDKTAQDLVTVGVATGGTVMYSKAQSGTYSETIPQETAAGTYIVYYMVKGDANHTDTAPGYVSVTIKPKEITPTITLSPTSYVYDGSAKNPSVTVMDGNDTIDAAEYSATYQNNINAGTATVTVSDANGGNYRILNGTATFQIAKAPSACTPPEGKANLSYNGTAQELVKAGSTFHGTMLYSLDKQGPYSTDIPTETARGSYAVWYKVEGDGNHSDSTPEKVDASIIINNVIAPIIQVTPESAPYNGQKQELTVTVKDDKGFLIDSSEYTMTYTDASGNSELINVGEYKLLIASTGNNYNFTTNVTNATFTILSAGQTPLIITNTREHVCYGETIQLDTTGGNGTVTWGVSGSATVGSQDGLLKITGVGSVAVTATSKATGYDDQTATWRFYADKKPVTAVVTAAPKTYDGNTTATVTAALQSVDLVGSDKLQITLAGTFEDPNVGTDKKVTVNSTNPDFAGSTGNHENYYDITYPTTATASIFKADVDSTKVTAPTAKNGLVYTGAPLPLLAVDGSSPDGTMEYSLDNRTYSASFPTETNAGSYDVWYRVKGDGNHNDSAGIKLGVMVTIDPQNIADPIIELAPSGAICDGLVHKPAVTVQDGSRVIPNTEYDVDYGNTDWTTAGNHEVAISGRTGGNYTFSGTVTKTFQIKAATASVIDAPQPKNLTYNGSAQELVTPGTAANGHVVYSRDENDSYTTSIPTGENAGNYTVWYKVQGDNGASDTSPVSVSVTIKPQTVNNPTILLDNQLTYSAPYTGKAVEPAVTLIVNGQLLTSNYTVTYSNNTNIGTATVLVQSTTGGNYQFYAVTTFQIVKAQAKFDTDPVANKLFYTGQAQELVTAGTANGIVLYSLDAASYTARIPTGINAGSYTVYAKVQGSSQYEESDVVVIPVEIGKNEVSNPKVTLSSDSFSYSGSAQKPAVTVSDDSGNVIDAGEYEVTCSGDATNPGTYTLTVASRGINYSFAPVQCEFTILAPGVTQAPEKVDGLVYNGSAQALVSGGTAESGKTLEYSLDNSDYSADIPTGTNAGTYTVWYRVAGDNTIAPASIEVEVAKATPSITANPTASAITSGQPLSASTLTGGTVTGISNSSITGTFAWAGEVAAPVNGTDYEVIFRPDDTTNYNTVTFTVTVTVTAVTPTPDPTPDPGGGTGSTPPADGDSSPSADAGSTPQTTVRNGTASTFVSAAAGSRLVRQAAANQSQNIVIQPEITSDVTRSEVSIPSSTVSEIQSKTNAALTVSAPMADVTIPNEALGALGSAGGTVNVVTEQVGQSVALTLTAGGQKVDSVPGGLTLSVPVEDAGPGTVAVLVHDDGTRETIRKSVVDNGKVNIPLDGSATVEIVDNSKEFTDVPPESWASDAVAFASAHELFSGTGETTFSPDEPISRGMLATVLYSLEGSPAQDTADEFSDVSGDAWYADGVAWATENGIADGYGNGQFGPDDSITREQFVVMLWKYAGSPEASDQTLAFTDADQVSGYARQALCWAVEKGVLSGGSDGQLAPGKTATRAQAAQMLKSFMENA